MIICKSRKYIKYRTIDIYKHKYIKENRKEHKMDIASELKRLHHILQRHENISSLSS